MVTEVSYFCLDNIYFLTILLLLLDNMQIVINLK